MAVGIYMTFFCGGFCRIPQMLSMNGRNSLFLALVEIQVVQRCMIIGLYYCS